MNKRVLKFIIFLSCIVLLYGCKDKDTIEEDIVEETIIQEEEVIESEEIDIDEEVDIDVEVEDEFSAEYTVEDDRLIFKSLEKIFAFADESGERLITFLYDNDDAFDDLEDYNIAIGNNGDIVEIEYERYQSANDENTYRQSMYNFDNLAGHIYRAKNGQLIKNKTYFLSKDTIINEETVIPFISPSSKAVDNEALERIIKAKDRNIVESNLISETKDGEKVYMVIFERIADDMLASIVYVRDDILVFNDYPAVYDKMSTWRIDGGDHPGIFEVLFLADSDQGLLLGLTWAGAEGELIYILKANEDIFEDTDLTTSRYWSPM